MYTDIYPISHHFYPILEYPIASKEGESFL